MALGCQFQDLLRSGDTDKLQQMYFPRPYRWN
jgi:hypothetical protein